MSYSKEDILNEIKKVVELNSGKMVGKRKFQSITGIKESDWKGKFWINWSDVVEEAGFKTRTFIKAWDANIMLERLADLVVELDHFPQDAELKMKRNGDKTFPNEKSYRKLGNKLSKARTLYEWCQNKPQYNRVIEICKPFYLEAIQQDLNNDDESDSAIRTGFVYLMKSGKYYKIGRTNSLDRRQYEIGLQLPEGIEPIHSIETDDPSGIEAYWHSRFKEKRLNGEWFDLSKKEVSIFKKRKFM